MTAEKIFAALLLLLAAVIVAGALASPFIAARRFNGWRDNDNPYASFVVGLAKSRAH